MAKVLDRSDHTAAPPEAQSAGSCVRPGLPHRPIRLRLALAAEAADTLAAHMAAVSGSAAETAADEIVVLDAQDHALIGQGVAFGVRRRCNKNGRSGWKRVGLPLSPAAPEHIGAVIKAALKQASDIVVAAQVDLRSETWRWTCGGVPVEVILERATGSAGGEQAAVASACFMSKLPVPEFFALVTGAVACDNMRLTAEPALARLLKFLGVASAGHASSFAPEIDAHMTAGEGFRAIAWACFGQFLLNEEAIRRTGDREAVHQGRVALRRFSACRRFFSGFVEGADFDAVRRELKVISGHLRQARDLDVLLGAVVPPAIADDPPEGTDALIRDIEAERATAHAELAAALSTKEAAAAFLRFAVWLEAGDWTKKSTDAEAALLRDMPLVKYARQTLEKRNRKFVARCAKLGEMDAEARHRTRISAKNIRYAAEFLGPLTRSKAARKRRKEFLQAVRELQTVLGDWNDLAAARQFFKSRAAASPESPAEEPIGSAAAALAERIAQIPEAEFRERTAAAAQSLAESKPFWSRLG